MIGLVVTFAVAGAFAWPLIAAGNLARAERPPRPPMTSAQRSRARTMGITLLLVAAVLLAAVAW